MKNLLNLFLITIMISACSPAANRERSFQNNHDSERCKKLSDRVDELKGKPIRRNAAYEQYLAECVNRS